MHYAPAAAPLKEEARAPSRVRLCEARGERDGSSRKRAEKYSYSPTCNAPSPAKPSRVYLPNVQTPLHSARSLALQFAVSSAALSAASVVLCTCTAVCGHCFGRLLLQLSLCVLGCWREEFTNHTSSENHVKSKIGFLKKQSKNWWTHTARDQHHPDRLQPQPEI